MIRGVYFVSLNTEAIRQLIMRDPLYGTIWDCLKEEKSAEVLVDGLEKRLSERLGQQQSSVRRIQLIKFLKELQNIEAGRFIPGRKALNRSRFVFHSALLQSITEDPQLLTMAPAEVAKTAEAASHTHVFLVRRDYPTSITLPVDLKKSEADRLADFIRSLPFER